MLHSNMQQTLKGVGHEDHPIYIYQCYGVLCPVPAIDPLTRRVTTQRTSRDMLLHVIRYHLMLDQNVINALGKVCECLGADTQINSPIIMDIIENEMKQLLNSSDFKMPGISILSIKMERFCPVNEEDIEKTQHTT